MVLRLKARESKSLPGLPNACKTYTIVTKKRCFLWQRFFVSEICFQNISSHRGGGVELYPNAAMGKGYRRSIKGKTCGPGQSFLIGD